MTSDDRPSSSFGERGDSLCAPLAGIRVLDLSRVLAGPSCTQILGDLGADVIKVERPGTGDDTRHWGPPFVSDAAEGRSAYFYSTNRNKRSITVDIKHPRGVDIIRSLAAKSDVLVENYKTGDLDACGLGWSDLHAKLPRLIYCSISGFGRTGPMAEDLGYDFIIQAMAGLMSVTGPETGGPFKVGVPIADIVAGLYAAISILAALEGRRHSGQGTLIDLSLLDCMVACLYNQGANYLVGGTAPTRFGNAHPNLVPYQSFETADGSIALGVGNDDQFRRLCDVLGVGDLARHAAYATNSQRLAHRHELVGKLATVLHTRTTVEWQALLLSHHLPVGPIHTIPQALGHPQVRHRDMIEEARGPAAPAVIKSPIHMKGLDRGIRRLPAALGEHTEEILADILQYAPEQIAGLRSSGAI